MKPGFYGPRSRANARLLIDAAIALGYPTSVVKTTRAGYNAPEAVIQAALGVSGIKEGVTYPAPENVPPGGAQALERPNNGASRAEWVAYAESVGIEVTADDTRNGLVKKVDARKEGTD
jgi:hypothetical protein